MKNKLITCATVLCTLLPAYAHSAEAKKTEPIKQEAPKEGARYRTNTQNFKDRVLAFCIARAYKDDEGASDDAYGVGAHLFGWTGYSQDPNVADPEAGALIDQYLSRKYRDTPWSDETGIKVPFNLAKCLDLYHSEALEKLVRKHVFDPDKIAGG